MAKTKATEEPGSAAATPSTPKVAFNPAAPMAAWMEVMQESARFITDRLQTDIETQQAMLACRTPAELMQVQTEFFQTAMQQYAEEAQRLAQIMSRASHTRGYDDVPL